MNVCWTRYTFYKKLFCCTAVLTAAACTHISGGTLSIRSIPYKFNDFTIPIASLSSSRFFILFIFLTLPWSFGFLILSINNPIENIKLCLASLDIRYIARSANIRTSDGLRKQNVSSINTSNNIYTKRDLGGGETIGILKPILLSRH